MNSWGDDVFVKVHSVEHSSDIILQYSQTKNAVPYKDRLVLWNDRNSQIFNPRLFLTDEFDQTFNTQILCFGVYENYLIIVTVTKYRLMVCKHDLTKNDGHLFNLWKTKYDDDVRGITEVKIYDNLIVFFENVYGESWVTTQLISNEAYARKNIITGPLKFQHAFGFYNHHLLVCDLLRMTMVHLIEEGQDYQIPVTGLNLPKFELTVYYGSLLVYNDRAYYARRDMLVIFDLQSRVHTHTLKLYIAYFMEYDQSVRAETFVNYDNYTLPSSTPGRINHRFRLDVGEVSGPLYIYKDEIYVCVTGSTNVWAKALLSSVLSATGENSPRFQSITSNPDRSEYVLYAHKGYKHTNIDCYIDDRGVSLRPSFLLRHNVNYVPFFQGMYAYQKIDRYNVLTFNNDADLRPMVEAVDRTSDDLWLHIFDTLLVRTKLPESAFWKVDNRLGDEEDRASRNLKPLMSLDDCLTSFRETYSTDTDVLDNPFYKAIRRYAINDFKKVNYINLVLQLVSTKAHYQAILADKSRIIDKSNRISFWNERNRQGNVIPEIFREASQSQRQRIYDVSDRITQFLGPNYTT